MSSTVSDHVHWKGSSFFVIISEQQVIKITSVDEMLCRLGREIFNTNEVAEDVMELSTSKGDLRIHAEVKSLRFKNATLRQHTKNLEEILKTFA